MNAGLVRYAGLFAGFLALPAALLLSWLNQAQARLDESDGTSDVAIASASEDSYCTPKLKQILRRVAGSCGLLEGSARGCKPADAKNVAQLSGDDFNALFKPLAHRAKIIQFDKDVVALDAGGTSAVESAWSDQRGASFFFVVARASPDGNAVHNQELSQSRAQSVLTHLEERFHDPELRQEVGLLWLGEDFAQLSEGILHLATQSRNPVYGYRHQPVGLCRMDRLRHLKRAAGLALGLLLGIAAVGCGEKKPALPSSGRFDAVRSQPNPAAAATFCDLRRPAQGQESLHFTEPPLRAVPGRSPTQAIPGWRWLNLWASWCGPCLEEMALLGKWKQSLLADGLSVDLELVSIDEDEQAFTKALTRELPGRVSWLRSADDLAPFLTQLGVDTTSAIPIHVFIDPQGMLRCVRVGSVREGDFGSIKALVGTRPPQPAVE